MKPSHHSPPGRLVRELKQFISIQFWLIPYSGCVGPALVIITQLAAWTRSGLNRVIKPQLSALELAAPHNNCLFASRGAQH